MCPTSENAPILFARTFGNTRIPDDRSPWSKVVFVYADTTHEAFFHLYNFFLETYLSELVGGMDY